MSPRGEKKAGGRPPIAEELKRVTLTCRVKPETKQWLENQKITIEKGIGEIVDQAIEVLQQHLDKFPLDAIEEGA